MIHHHLRDAVEDEKLTNEIRDNLYVPHLSPWESSAFSKERDHFNACLRRKQR